MRVARLRRLLVYALVREFALDYAATRKRFADGRPRFTRVSPDWLEQVEAEFKATIRRRIDALPSVGRTIE